MLSAVIFYIFLLLILVIFPATMILIVLLFLDHEHQLGKEARVIIGTIANIMVQVLKNLGLKKRYPRITIFLARRFDSQDPWGLSATIAGFGILFGLWFFLSVLQDIIAKDPLVILNIRLHNTMILFRTAGVTQFMLILTQLGSSTFLLLLCLGIVMFALANQQRRLAITFILAGISTSVISVTLKSIFNYARPIDAIISVNEASFPSGHMLSSTVIYGLLAAILLGSGIRRGIRALGITFLLLIIVGIGLSRLYLGVHWPSDLLGSLALAFIVLASLLFFLHYDRPIRWVDSFKIHLDSRILRITGGIIIIVALGTSAIIAKQVKIIPVVSPLAEHTINIQELGGAFPADLPYWSEDLIGTQMEPISLVFVGSEEDLISAFAYAGWMKADSPTPLRVVQETLAALRNQPDLTGPVTPAFFADRPQNIAFEKQDAKTPSIRRRHHTRLWKTTYCLTPNCRPVWVGTASYDIGVEFSKRLYLPTHRIDPAIDNERTLIVDSLIPFGAKLVGNIIVSGPIHGMNAAGDTFSTDGLAFVVVFPPK